MLSTLMLKKLIRINFWLFYSYSRPVFSCKFMHYKTNVVVVMKQDSNVCRAITDYHPGIIFYFLFCEIDY